MNNLKTTITSYLNYCAQQKRLDTKILNAYTTDLRQFADTVLVDNLSSITPSVIEAYLSHSHHTYKPKTVKRKIASLKAFFHYL